MVGLGHDLDANGMSGYKQPGRTGDPPKQNR